ncbi:hypothetical protein BGZ54_002823, partial [Gamsiella multidivaricata]
MTTTTHSAATAQPHRTRTNTCKTDHRRTSRKPWATWLGLSTAVILMTLPTLTTAAPTPNLNFNPAAAASSITSIEAPLQKRAIVYVVESEPAIELTFEANDSYYLESLKLDECTSTLSLPLTPGTAGRNYSAITAPDPEMALNFYTDENCQEYDFSVVSEVHEFAGYFASVKYVGQYSDVKPGVYDKQEISRTAVPDGEPQDPLPAPGSSSPTTTTTTTNAPAGSTDSATSQSAYSSAGFAVGMGIVGFVAMAGIVGLGVFLYRNHGGDKKKRTGEGGRFMSLSSGRDDYDDEVGLTGENGPHSSALMQSRVGISFDDER